MFNVRSYKHVYGIHFSNNAIHLLNQYSNNHYYLIDQNILNLHKDKLKLKNVICVESDEQNKNIFYCEGIISQLIDGAQKNSILVAIGGGTVQDVVGFVASVLYRGVEWEFFPTTLLSQADSCIGSKTSLNFGIYKNILGGFYPPAKIVIDRNFLKTLPIREIKSGIGEILHFLFLNNDSNILRELTSRYDAIMKNITEITPYISRVHYIKRKIVEIDEFDEGPRNTFNYGHTFGHAIESLSNYEVCHGQAVTMGMDLANYISMKLNMIDLSEYKTMFSWLVENMPEYKIEDISGYIHCLRKDKKNYRNNLGCILTRGLGKMEKVYLEFDNKLENMILEWRNS